MDEGYFYRYSKTLASKYFCDLTDSDIFDLLGCSLKLAGFLDSFYYAGFIDYDENYSIFKQILSDFNEAHMGLPD